MSSNSSRLAEAEQCEKKAAECLKTSFIKMKLKPDHDGAATAMERASVCYRNASEPRKAAAALETAAQHYEQCNNRFHAAKAREQAAMLLRDAGDPEAAAEQFEKAVDGYAEAGSLDTAAMTVDKAGKSLKHTHPDKAIKLYEKGLCLVQQSDRSKMAGEFLSQLTRLNLAAERWPKALEAIREEMDKYAEVNEPGRVGQLALAAVLVQLVQGDSIAAAKEAGRAISMCAEFEYSDEARVCRQLIGVYESGDDERFQEVLAGGTLRSMDNCYLRIMKKLKAPKVEGGGGVDGEDEDEDDLK